MNYIELLLQKLSFKTIRDNVYVKTYNNVNAKIVVDLNEQCIFYPSNLINAERKYSIKTTENLVVLECIDHLFTLGYFPFSIELEKTWRIGHNDKGGRFDIIVYDLDLETHTKKDSVFMLIECKTMTEYNSALKQLCNDGGQLFSYWELERSAKFLVLYTSWLNNNQELEHNGVIIETQNKHYQTAKNSTDLFHIWKEEEQSSILPITKLFSSQCVPYTTDTFRITKQDLVDFNPNDKIINQFEEILRHNNISDKENAFNKLVVLFICKLKDEMNATSDDYQMEFQWHPSDDPWEFQDRLQKLYRDGMKSFMHEDIAYFANNDFDKLLNNELYDSVKLQLKTIIKELKFESSNILTFMDVHNKTLFLQNNHVLSEIVQLFQKYRLIAPTKNQFLGDLFEQLLNHGFKQNEGQFFTPMTITNFIWNSLPLKTIIANNQNNFPKIIDYSCGAGHFLTQGVQVIDRYYEQQPSLPLHIQQQLTYNDWVTTKVYGIEKDYRLAKVSKLSMFMNGAGKSNIIHGDGLNNYHDLGVTNNSFDILVANPPYSVSEFKNHLMLNNELKTLKYLSSTSSEIETLFIERTAQLLKENSVSAIILPSSISTKDIKPYVFARQLLLNNFLIKGIVMLGGKTFGATSVNTIILFLQKNTSNYAIAKDIATKIFCYDALNDNEKNIFNAYLKLINVSKENYALLMNKDSYVHELAFWNNCLKIYSEFFINAKDKIKAVNEIIKLEQEKLTAFIATYNQKTIFARMPLDPSAQEKFLGYSWSNRKGSEGIFIHKDGGEFYNPNDYDDPTMLNTLIKQAFENVQNITIPAKYNGLVSYNQLSDMLDFESDKFTYRFITTPKTHLTFKNADNQEAIGNLITINAKSKIKVNQALQTGQFPFYTSGLRIFKCNEALATGKNIYLATGGNAVVNYYDGKAGYSTDTLSFKSSNENMLRTEFLYLVLKAYASVIKKDYFKGQALQHLQKPDFLSHFTIPIYSIAKQDDIIAKCSHNQDPEYIRSLLE